MFEREPTQNNNIIKCGDKLISLNSPVIMGILNITTDSFYDGGEYTDEDSQLIQAEKMVREGASIIDIGGISTRPDSKPIAEEIEIQKVTKSLETLTRHFPDMVFSVDTYRTNVAKAAINSGAKMINDISAGTFDPGMLPLIAKQNITYIMMHTPAMPETMQINPRY
ncbi:MAG: dihydropteroate synthase, partial [Bacteroidales bacterium]|nr:dihydropteroate synthase [Bacteroidales bacterium]